MRKTQFSLNWESVAKLLFILISISALAVAQQTGLVETPDVDLSYEVLGEPGAAIPIANMPVIVANGGPGLSHIYMIQNDVWTRLAKGRQIVFYDQRGTGKSTRVKAGAPQDIDAQIADLEAIRAKFNFQKFDLVGDSYGGFLRAHRQVNPQRFRPAPDEEHRSRPRAGLPRHDGT
jgi:proline iminopeptidase